MGSSTYCLDMDYLLVCIVSRQSRVSVPHLGKKASFNKISYSFEIKQYVLGALCLEGHYLYGRSLG